MGLPAYQEPQEDESAAPSLEAVDGGGTDESATNNRPDLQIAQSQPNLQVVQGGYGPDPLTGEEHFAQPASTTLTPPQPAQLEGQPDFSGGVGKTVDTREQAGYAPRAAAVAGGGEAAKEAGGAEAAAKPRGFRQRWSEGRAQVQEYQEQLKEQATNELKKVVKDQIKKFIKQQVKAFISEVVIATFPEWGPIVGIILLILAVVIGIAIAWIRLSHGTVPPTQYGVGTESEGAVKSLANPEGLYLRMMTPQLTFQGKTGEPTTLAMESTAGEWAEENPLARGTGAFGTKSYNQTTHTTSDLSDEDLKFYVNMRWPYKTYFPWGGGEPGGPKPAGDYASHDYYAGAKVIVFNPKTNKAVVGVIADWGPAPATGVCKFVKAGAGFTVTENTDTGNPLNAGKPTACKDEKVSWNARYKDGKIASAGTDFHTPADYTGRIMGTAKGLGDLIGIETNSVVIAGFARDQGVKAGTVYTVSASDIIHPGDTVQTGAQAGVLSVPGIEEGVGGECGAASINMVALYYLSDKGTHHLSFADLPKSMTTDHNYIVDKSPVSPNAWFTTEDKLDYSCVSSGYLNAMPEKVPKGWTTVPLSSSETLRAAIRSVKAGDPVVFYSIGAIYKNKDGTPHNHIFVLVGYDEKTNEFIINNPYVHGVDLGVHGGNTGNMRMPLTLDYLFSKRGDPYYSHTLIIRGTYL